MRIVSLVGARPQFIKAAPVCRALRERHDEILVHSGQHFDYDMSDVFFEELGIPKPDYNLGVGGGGHGRMTGEMLGQLEELFLDMAPDWVLVYGDTNTTLAGSLAAAKLNIPVAHVEAGLRSFNRSMPEEVNRVVADHVSSLLLCPTNAAVANLAAEGITDGVALVGDVMLDTARMVAERVSEAEVLAAYGLEHAGYYLATVHRAATSDDPERLGAVLRAFARLDRPVVFAVHPRTRKNMEAFGLADLADSPSIRLVPPISYLEMSALLRGAQKLLTDSGGMQKEAYFFGVPCVTLRDETEWVETVELGWNALAGTDEQAIVGAAGAAFDRSAERPPVYGDGHAAEACVAALEGLPVRSDQ
jgi:UDP-N-acetylglucosamine 2-epimerase